MWNPQPTLATTHGAAMRLAVRCRWILLACLWGEERIEGPPIWPSLIASHIASRRNGRKRHQKRKPQPVEDCGFLKSHRMESNHQPPLYESGALPVELRWRAGLGSGWRCLTSDLMSCPTSDITLLNSSVRGKPCLAKSQEVERQSRPIGVGCGSSMKGRDGMYGLASELRVAQSGRWAESKTRRSESPRLDRMSDR